MILDEFASLIVNIVDKDFPVREAPISFNMSMKLQVNEIDSERHNNMLFPEFLEALSRIIDKASPIPVGENSVKIFI